MEERKRQTEGEGEREKVREGDGERGKGERGVENYVKWCSVHINGLSFSTSMGKFSIKFILLHKAGNVTKAYLSTPFSKLKPTNASYKIYTSHRSYTFVLLYTSYTSHALFVRLMSYTNYVSGVCPAVARSKVQPYTS